MTDRLIIRDLLLRGIIGINDWERENPQDIMINLTIETDLAPSGRSDDIGDTVNYRTITKEIIKQVEQGQRLTVEALAQDIASICLSYEGVESVRVRVEKPGALRFADSVGVEIIRP